MTGRSRTTGPGTIAAAVAVAIAVHAAAVGAMLGSAAGLAALLALAFGAVFLKLAGRLVLPTGNVRRSRRGSSAARSVVSLLGAVGTHVGLLLLIGLGLISLDLTNGTLFANQSPADAARARQEQAERDARDEPLQIEQLVDTLRHPDEQPPEKDEAEKKEEEDKNAHGQVVELARPLIEERPDKADYLSEYDSKVDRETKGRSGRGEAGEVAPVKPDRRHDGSSAPPGNPLARPGIPGPLAMREKSHVGLPGQGGGSELVGPDGELRTPGDPSARPSRNPSAGGEDGIPGRPGAPNLKPSEEALSRAIGHGAGSLDYLRDIDDGESTALNAKKWKYATFFNRVKRAVADEWHPDVVYLRHDPSGNVYGSKDRVTILRVHVRPDGHLETVTMLQGSGVDFLDDEAMDAFRRAQPFPNPPPQLVEGDGLIHFNFGFIFELSGHTTFKFFKYE